MWTDTRPEAGRQRGGDAALVKRRAVTPTAAEAFADHFRAALAGLNAGSLPDAAAHGAALQQIAPQDPAVLQLLATIALRDGRPGEALAGLRHSLERRPGHVPSLILMARAARAAGVPPQAVAPLREAVRRAPELAEPAFLLCQTLADCADPSLGTALAATAAQFPAHADDWAALGLALQRSQHPTEALAAFTRAVAAAPGLAQAQFGRGLLLREAGRPKEAWAALHQAVLLDPTASAAWFALGLTCQDCADEAGAARAFAEALRLRENFAEAAVNLGIAHQRLGDMAAAVSAYRQAVQIRPDTLGRIAQAMTAASTGMLCLDVGGLRRLLGA